MKRRAPTRAGFTLIELAIVTLIVSVIVTAAYQLFANSSAAMAEVDALAESVDSARFAAEIVARDLQAAGAFATPDSDYDTLAHWAQIAPRRVRGIYQFPRGADARQIDPVQSVWNPVTARDELIVLGSYDFPFTFEVTFNGTNYASALAPNTPRGALRFAELDPFNQGAPVALAPGFSAGVLRHMNARLMRVTDRNGYMQFASIAAASYNNTPGSGGFAFALPSAGQPLSLRARQGAEKPGLEPAGELGDGYEAAVIDAIRYRVCADAVDPANLRLVRERLDAAQLTEGTPPPYQEMCEAATVGPTEYVRERQTLAEYVVDFRVWYDCAPREGTTYQPGPEPGRPTAQTPGLMQNQNWSGGWIPPAGPGHNCLALQASGAPAAPTSAGTANMARVAHVRLSVRAPSQVADTANYGFLTLDASGVPGTLNATNSTSGDPALSATVPAVGDLSAEVVSGLQTFSTDADPSSAAKVKTIQIDVDLVNFANRERVRIIERGDAPSFQY